jgi:hypothetical protein
MSPVKNLCLWSGSGEADAASSKSREIDKLLRADEKKMAKEIKVLLLGQSKAVSNPSTHRAISRRQR